MYFNKLFGFHTDFNIEIHVQINIEILFLCMVQKVNRIWIIFFGLRNYRISSQYQGILNHSLK